MSEEIDKAINTFIKTTLEMESAIQQYQRAEAQLDSAVTTIGKKLIQPISIQTKSWRMRQPN